VLRKYLVAERSIQEIVAHFREDHYGMLRGLPPAQMNPERNDGLRRPDLGDMEIATVPVDIGRSKIVGRSLADVDLRGRYGITILAIRRQGRTLTQLSDSERIRTDDTLYLLGTAEHIGRLHHDLR
jgi:CPA2 family monovalent cation:H+ antiporter-2